MSPLSPAATALVRLMSELPRGPRREGVFAVWLTLRVAEDLLLVPPPPERGSKRRVAALELDRRGERPGPGDLREARRDRVGQALLLLVAPAREILGPEASEIVARAARSAAQH